ncbi:Uncharacterised protein [uncultured archaeon]|nr:Uncharacterised protein [uncultured archaeon]
MSKKVKTAAQKRIEAAFAKRDASKPGSKEEREACKAILKAILDGK